MGDVGGSGVVGVASVCPLRQGCMVVVFVRIPFHAVLLVLWMLRVSTVFAVQPLLDTTAHQEL